MQNSRLVEIPAGRCRHGVIEGSFCEDCRYFARADRRLLWMIVAGIAAFVLLLAASMYAQAPTSPAKPPEAVSLPPTPQGHNIQASAESLQEIGQQQMQLDSQAALLREWNAWAKQVKEIVDKTACKAPAPPNKEP